MYAINLPVSPAVLALALSAALAASAVAAQKPQARNDSNTLEVVTVVGSATNTVVSPAALERYQANDLADVFRLAPSISVGGSVGIAQKIYIRGLEDSLINVTVDGAPQTSTLFHHIGRVSIDPELLQRVDVQAGAGEATSGAGAIGGAIRFQTKEVDDLLAGDEMFGGKIKASTFSNEGSQYSATLYGRFTDNIKGIAYFKNVDSKNNKDGDSNNILATAAEQRMAFFKITGDISENQTLSLSYETRDEDGEFSARPNWFVQNEDSLYSSEAERKTLVANYNWQHSDVVNFEATAYQTESSFRGGRFDWLAEISTVGFDIRNTSAFGIHSFIYGLDYRDDQVESGYATPKPEEDHAEEGSVLGAYAQVHTQLSDDLLLSYGLRYDDYKYQQKILLDNYYGDPITGEAAKIDDAEVSVNAGLEYRITEQWTFGLGYAEAARGKEIGDGFTLDGYLYDRSDAAVVDPGLRAETVSNIEPSLQYSRNELEVKLAVFRSEIDNAIFERLYGNSLYENIGTVETTGFELDLAYQWETLEVFLGFSRTDSELDPASGLYTSEFDSIALNGYEFIGLGNSRGDSWNLGLNYSAQPDLVMGFNVSHVESITIDSLQQDKDLGFIPALYSLRKPSYTVVDVFAEWRASDSLTFSLAVSNVFDKLYRDHSSVGDFSAVAGYEKVIGPWETGRDVRVSASYNF